MINKINTYIFIGIALSSLILISRASFGTVGPQPNIINVTDTISSNAGLPVLDINLNNSAIIFFNATFSPKSVSSAIQKIEEANAKGFPSIYLLFNSPGGDIDSGSKLIEAIQSSAVPVYTVVVGECASMCANTIQYGVKRYMLDRTSMMFHSASFTLKKQSGEVDRIISELLFIQSRINKMDIHTAMRSKQSYQLFKLKSEMEYYVDAEDALHDGLIDAIVNLQYIKDVASLPTPKVDNQ